MTRQKRPFVPLLKPYLPDASKLKPYLEQIDETRIYSNGGPLNRTFQSRLAQQFGCLEGHIATASSGTSALTAALIGVKQQREENAPYCVMPSWTFIATPLAAISAGLKPYFLDIDPQSGILDIEATEHLLSQIKDKVAAIVVVQPFGQPLSEQPWKRLRQAFDIPVVFDSATCFDTLTISEIPKVLSFHATKVLSTGEGGAVICTDEHLVTKIRSIMSSGFSGERISREEGFNSKMSEYHAAIGLASLDMWPQTRRCWVDVAEHYNEHLNHSFFSMPQGFGGDWITSTLVVGLGAPAAKSFIHALTPEFGIRDWWGDGAHTHPSLKKYKKSNLDITHAFAQSSVALPFSVHMEKEDIKWICEKLIQYYNKIRIDKCWQKYII